MTITLEKLLYNSGDVFLPKSVRDLLASGLYFDKTRSFYLNGWTLLHFISGMLVGWIYLYLKKPIQYYYYKLFIIHTIWELWQMLIGMSKPWKLTGNSNLIDIIVDTISFMLGGYLLKIFY